MDETTQWGAPGFGLWRRERGAMLRALAIYAALATVAGVFCALGWRWQTRLSDRALDIAEEHRSTPRRRWIGERRMLLALGRAQRGGLRCAVGRSVPSLRRRRLRRGVPLCSPRGTDDRSRRPTPPGSCSPSCPGRGPRPRGGLPPPRVPAEVDAAPARARSAVTPRTFRRGVCRTCHRKLSDGGAGATPGPTQRPGLLWLSRRDYLMAWRATLPPTVDRLVGVFAAPIAAPADALSLIATTPAPLGARRRPVTARRPRHTPRRRTTPPPRPLPSGTPRPQEGQARAGKGARRWPVEAARRGTQRQGGKSGPRRGRRRTGWIVEGVPCGPSLGSRVGPSTP